MCLKKITKQYRGFGYKLMVWEDKVAGILKSKFLHSTFQVGEWYYARQEENAGYHCGFHIYKNRPLRNLSMPFNEDVWVRVEYRGIHCEGLDKLRFRKLKNDYAWWKVEQIDERVPVIVSPCMRIVKVY